MDPKMDNCVGLESLHGLSTDDVYYVPTIKVDWVDINHLTISLFASQVSFINGYSIIETTHKFITCWSQNIRLFEVVEDEKMQAFSLFSAAVIKTIGYVFKLVLSADIYEGKCRKPYSFWSHLITFLSDRWWLFSKFQTLYCWWRYWTRGIPNQVWWVHQESFISWRRCNSSLANKAVVWVAEAAVTIFLGIGRQHHQRSDFKSCSPSK